MLVPIVVEKSANGERSYDIYSRLLHDRIVVLNEDVNSHTAGLVVAQMLFLENKDPEQDILFYINSPGGSITDGMAIYDTMQNISCDVATVALGQVASMGSILSSSGTKGKRYIMPNCRTLIHQPLGGAQGQASDILIQSNEIIRMKTLLTDIYAQNTGQSLETLVKDMDRDTILTAEQAVAYGLADKIVVKKVKKGS